MKVRADTADFASVLLSGVPLLDVRAPLEFSQGAFPGSVNIPLMNDEERHLVGLKYKNAGQDKAITLGHSLVSGEIKEQRIAQWVKFAQTHPDGYLYCFRGGLRSSITQQWLSEAGHPYPRVIGGYKAMRTFLIDRLVETIEQSTFVMIAGLTGCGKTQVIQQLDAAIDLEGLAHHRGSSFGKHATDQPTQIDFDHALTFSFMRLHAAGVQRIALEDESRLIGKCALPVALRHVMQVSPVVWVEEPIESRVERILHDYVHDLGGQFVRKLGAVDGFDAYSARLLESLFNLHKRLGGERHDRLHGLMREALEVQKKTDDLTAHCEWIRPLLIEYYDPMYEHQRAGKAARIVFSGDRETVTCHLKGQGY